MRLDKGEIEAMKRRLRMEILVAYPSHVLAHTHGDTKEVDIHSMGKPPSPPCPWLARPR